MIAPEVLTGSQTFPETPVIPMRCYPCFEWLKGATLMRRAMAGQGLQQNSYE